MWSVPTKPSDSTTTTTCGADAIAGLRFAVAPVRRPPPCHPQPLICRAILVYIDLLGTVAWHNGWRANLDDDVLPVATYNAHVDK